uniref:BTB domain-containing protein n=1 Tax=Panagrellus redivivus TaxID=6233 RepID=A0A7E4VG69_PANRE
MASTTASLPKTLKLHTLDNEVVEVTENIVNECEALKIPSDYPEVDVFEAPFESSGFKNAFKFLEFYGQNEPFNPSFDYDAFVQATKPAMKFLHGLSEEDKAELLYTIDYLQCKRLNACIQMYNIIMSNYEIEEIGGLSDFVEIQTSDDKIITFPRKVAIESNFLIRFYKAFGSIPDSQVTQFSSHVYHKALKVLILCDLDSPHVPLEIASPHAPMTPELSAFTQANQPAMDYFNSLMNLDLYEIGAVASTLSIRRLCDLINVYILNLDADTKERVLRGQAAIDEYFRHMEGIHEDEDEDIQYVSPAEGA